MVLNQAETANLHLVNVKFLHLHLHIYVSILSQFYLK